MKKVFLYAYVKNNLGDDLFIREITSRYSNTKFFLIASNAVKNTFRDIRNLKVINEDSSFLKSLKKIRNSLYVRYINHMEDKCNCVVYIGGSIFIQYPSWANMLNWWDYKANTTALYIIGANFGPYNEEGFKNGLHNVFSRCKDVCFRDKYSFNKFSDLPTVRCAPDILFSYQLPVAKKISNQVFISVISCKNRDGIDNDCYLETLLNTIKNLIHKHFKVILSSFCKNEGDEDTITYIMDNLCIKEKDNVEVLNYNGFNTDEIIEGLVKSKFVIASRFHAVILGISAGCKVLPLIYSDKTENVLNDIGFEAERIDIRSLKNNNILNIELADNISKLSLESIRVESVSHFKKLDSVINKKNYYKVHF